LISWSSKKQNKLDKSIGSARHIYCEQPNLSPVVQL